MQTVLYELIQQKDNIICFVQTVFEVKGFLSVKKKQNTWIHNFSSVVTFMRENNYSFVTIIVTSIISITIR